MRIVAQLALVGYLLYETQRRFPRRHRRAIIGGGVAFFIVGLVIGELLW